MSQSMVCQDYDALIARDLEGELSPDEQRRVDAHLLDCGRCSALRRELVEIARAARELPLMSPSRDLWDGIAARIEAPVIALEPGAERANGHRRIFRFAAAAVALIAVTAATTYVITRESLERAGMSVASDASTGRPAATNANDPAAPTLVAEPSGGPAEAAFEREVVQLRTLLEQRRPDLDSATVAVLEHNLRIIDQAIAESRAALAKDPGSALLNHQLHNALGKKVQVLRTAALLPVGTQ